MTFVVRREGETNDGLLKRFRKRVHEDGIMAEMRKRRYHKTKGEKRREMAKAAVRRRKKKEREKRQEGLY